MAQQVEMAILIHLLWLIHKSLNTVSDSAYVAGLFSSIETDLALSSHFYASIAIGYNLHIPHYSYSCTLTSLQKEIASWYNNLPYLLIHPSFHVHPLLRPWAINSMAVEVEETVKVTRKSKPPGKGQKDHVKSQVCPLGPREKLLHLMTLCLQMDLETIIDSFTHLRKRMHLTFPWDLDRFLFA